MSVTPEQVIGAIEPLRPTREARLVPFRGQVQRHILAMVRDSSLAEELTQDTYARALERIEQLRDPQAALAWLYRSPPRSRSTGCGSGDRRPCRSIRPHPPAGR